MSDGVSESGSAPVRVPARPRQPRRERWVRFEDDHLLAVTKPAGVNTHRADVNVQDGMYEWVQRQRAGVSLSILHRLDKATSGLLVFGKSATANQSLARQFEDRTVVKRYELLVQRDDRRPGTLRCDEPIRHGKSVDRDASTDFERHETGAIFERWTAHPHTGRTHQVRLHAAALGMAIVGDVDHGGIAAPRLFLHAASLRFDHPTSGPIDLISNRPASFDRALEQSEQSEQSEQGKQDEQIDPKTSTDRPNIASPRLAALVAHEARAALFDPADTNAYLWIDRHHDGFNRVRVERLGDVVLALNYRESSPLSESWLDAWSEPWTDAWSDDVDGKASETMASSPVAIYEQRRPRAGAVEPARLRRGTPCPRFEVTELRCRYLIDLEASATSSGLFIDQRETRRRLLATDLSGQTVLNAFAHTGSLSVATATAGAQTLSLDLSRRYLDWARDNLLVNGIDPDDHDFVYGDALDWMERFAKKGRTFDVVLIDPPSSSTSGSRAKKRWAVERDLHALVERGARLVAPGGTMFVSTNLRRMRWPRFVEHLTDGLAAACRRGTIETQTVPLDHRCGPGEPPYLKAAWIQLDGAAN